MPEGSGLEKPLKVGAPLCADLRLRGVTTLGIVATVSKTPSRAERNLALLRGGAPWKGGLSLAWLTTAAAALTTCALASQPERPRALVAAAPAFS